MVYTPAPAAPPRTSLFQLSSRGTGLPSETYGRRIWSDRSDNHVVTANYSNCCGASQLFHRSPISATWAFGPVMTRNISKLSLEIKLW